MACSEIYILKRNNTSENVEAIAASNEPTLMERESALKERMKKRMKRKEKKERERIEREIIECEEKKKECEEEKKECKEEKKEYEEEKKECELTERVHISYDNEKKIKNEISICTLQIENLETEIHDNQWQCSLKIVAKFLSRIIINIMVIALTQSGKTGAMIALINNYIKHNLIPISNIYIITGLSSTEWKKQTKSRMPACLEKRIFHRANLNTDFIKDIINKKNVLVIMDEVQIAAKENQSIHNAFKKAGFYDKQKLLRNDVKIVEFSATPDGTLYDLMKWGENSSIIKMEPGNRYTSCFDLLEKGRVKQSQPLANNKGPIKDNIIEIINDVHDISDKDEGNHRYHIIRTPSGAKSKEIIEEIKRLYKYTEKPEKDTVDCIKYDKDSDVDINDILQNKPEKDTFIFVKEKLRCAKTLIKTFIGVVYDRYVRNCSDSVIIQGLLGRLTGYDDNGISICYTNIDSIKNYKKLWDSGFKNKNVKWNSDTTKQDMNKELISKGTYNTLNGESKTNDNQNENKNDMYHHEWKEFSYEDIENGKERSNESLKECVNKWIKEKPSYEHTTKLKKGSNFKYKSHMLNTLTGIYKDSYSGTAEILDYQYMKNIMLSIDNGSSKKTANLCLGKNSSGCRRYVTYKDKNDKTTITIIVRYLEKK